MAKRVKKKEHELLTDVNIARVIGLLEAEKPITKKMACEILNIAYNTTRLNNIIESYVTTKEQTKKRRNANRGKKVTDYELETIIESYLAGESIVNISKVIYRSSSFIKNIIDNVGVPKRATGDEKAHPMFLPDMCVSEDFEKGETAWSAVYHAPCEIIKELSGQHYEDEYGCKCYNIYVIEPLEEALDMYPNITTGGFYASSPAFNIGKLSHLLKYGVKI